LVDITKRRKESIDFLGVWNAQMVDVILEDAIAMVSGMMRHSEKFWLFLLRNGPASIGFCLKEIYLRQRRLAY
jgi:hypothetical protein